METEEVTNEGVPRVQPPYLSPPSINMAMICNHLSFPDNLETLLLASELARIRVFTRYATRSPSSPAKRPLNLQLHLHRIQIVSARFCTFSNLWLCHIFFYLLRVPYIITARGCGLPRY